MPALSYTRLPTTAPLAIARSPSGLQANAKQAAGKAPCECVPHGEMWCVTRQDLRDLKRAVMEAWDEIPNPPKGEKFHNKDHYNTNIGPTVHQVVKYFLKKQVQPGESWALKLHPQGLKCDVFATHCWDEGIFEFIDKALHVFPFRAQNMYICFLANPQDDYFLKQVLNVEPSQSPFARALRSADYFVVIPNRHTVIYTRLWCVYEMYLAHKAVESRDLQIRMPWLLGNRWLAFNIIPLLILLPLMGAALGYALLPYKVQSFLGPVMWLILPLVISAAFRMTVRGISRFTMGSSFSHSTPMWEWRTLKYWNYIELLLVGFCGFVSLHYFEMKVHHRQHALANILMGDQAYLRLRWEAGEGVACYYIFLGLMCSYAYDLAMLLANEVLMENSHQMEFHSVLDADCSNPHDKAAIIKDISGGDGNATKIDEKVAADIDDAIEQLKHSGRYDRAVKFNLDKGLSPAFIRDGVNPFRIIVGACAWTFWITSDYKGTDHVRVANALPILTSFLLLAVIFLPTSIKERRPRGDSHYIFAVHAFFYAGLGFVIISNHPYFFNKYSVEGNTMRISTLPLQIGIFVLMLVVDAIFYCGIIAALWNLVDQDEYESDEESSEE